MRVPAVKGRVGFECDLFPLTPALSPKERETHLRVRQVRGVSDSSSDWRTFSLSLGERAGVRGNGTSAYAMFCGWGLTSGNCPRACHLAASTPPTRFTHQTKLSVTSSPVLMDTPPKEGEGGVILKSVILTFAEPAN